MAVLRTKIGVIQIVYLLGNEGFSTVSDLALTDEQITARLQAEGIQVTRRTVAKYREDMNIPSTHQRRFRSEFRMRLTGWLGIGRYPGFLRRNLRLRYIGQRIVIGHNENRPVAAKAKIVRAG